MKYIVARIFNNELISVVEVSSFDAGIELIKINIEDQFLRDVTPKEIEILENTGEFHKEIFNKKITFCVKSVIQLVK